jgi:hypothetical protein
MVNSFTANYGRIRFNNGVTTDPSGIFGPTGNQLVGIPGNPQQTAGFSEQNFISGPGNGPSTGGAGYPASFGANPSPRSLSTKSMVILTTSPGKRVGTC